MENILNFIRKTITEIIGDFDDIIVESYKNRVNITISNISVYSFDFENEMLVLKNGKDKVFISDYYKIVNDLLESNLTKTIYDFYKKDYISKLPSKMTDNTKRPNFSKLTEDWLKENFFEISEDIMNVEEIENIKIKESDDKLEILFDVDCGRYGLHRNCGLKISNKGNIKIDLDDTPLEGCGIESELKERIEEILW